MEINKILKNLRFKKQIKLYIFYHFFLDLHCEKVC